MSLNDKMTALADEIRNKTGGTESLTIDQMTKNIQNVFEAGEKSEYDIFWDAFQQSGQRRNYNFAFYGMGWNDNSFKPKYDIVVSRVGNSMTSIFQECRITNLSDILKKQGVRIDCSNYMGSNVVGMFNSAIYLTKVPEINIPYTANYGSQFYNCYSLHTIEGLYLSENGTQTFGENMFYKCTALENITVKGKIGNNFDIHWSPLTKDSILSIFNALLDATTGKNVSFSLSAVNKAFETADGVSDGSNSEEWKALLALKPGWIVSLL